MHRVLRRAGQALLDLFSPPACAACDQPPLRGAVLCRGCALALGERPAPFGVAGVPVLSAAPYRGSAGAALRRLKRQPELAVPLARLLAERLQPYAPSPGSWLVPVPLHPSRLAERGYNQAALLANHLSTIYLTRTAPLVLARIRPTERQAGGPAQRRENVRGVFVARRPIPGRRVVLIDDVVTTGATAEACIVALERAGAVVEGVIGVARAAR